MEGTNGPGHSSDNNSEQFLSEFKQMACERPELFGFDECGKKTREEMMRDDAYWTAYMLEFEIPELYDYENVPNDVVESFLPGIHDACIGYPFLWRSLMREGAFIAALGDEIRYRRAKRWLGNHYPEISDPGWANEIDVDGFIVETGVIEEFNLSDERRSQLLYEIGPFTEEHAIEMTVSALNVDQIADSQREKYRILWETILEQNNSEENA